MFDLLIYIVSPKPLKAKIKAQYKADYQRRVKEKCSNTIVKIENARDELLYGLYAITTADGSKHYCEKAELDGIKRNPLKAARLSLLDFTLTDPSPKEDDALLKEFLQDMVIDIDIDQTVLGISPELNKLCAELALAKLSFINMLQKKGVERAEAENRFDKVNASIQPEFSTETPKGVACGRS